MYTSSIINLNGIIWRPEVWTHDKWSQVVLPGLLLYPRYLTSFHKTSIMSRSQVKVGMHGPSSKETENTWAGEAYV